MNRDDSSIIDVRAFHGAHHGTWTVEVRTEDGGYVLNDLYSADRQKLIRDLGEAMAHGDTLRPVIERWAAEIDAELKLHDRLTDAFIRLGRFPDHDEVDW